jgi:hypothetical protein
MPSWGQPKLPLSWSTRSTVLAERIGPGSGQRATHRAAAGRVAVGGQGCGPDQEPAAQLARTGGGVHLLVQQGVLPGAEAALQPDQHPPTGPGRRRSRRAARGRRVGYQHPVEPDGLQAVEPDSVIAAEHRSRDLRDHGALGLGLAVAREPDQIAGCSV